MIITPTFTTNFDANFGANAAAAKAAWIAASEVFTSHFLDDININITVDALPGTRAFGESFPGLVAISYADLLARVAARATTQSDHLALGPQGSMTPFDPTNGTGDWSVTRAQAKALGVIANDTKDDGGTTFGAGNPFTFSGPIAAGTYDFQGIAAHEISEVMGRLGLCGGGMNPTSKSVSLIDNFSYTGPGTKSLRGGAGNFFSIDNGVTLLKLWNDQTANGLDSRDWAGGTNDAFNQFSGSGVVNAVSAVDLLLMDVIGYDLGTIPGQLLSYGDAATPGNVSDPTVVGFGGWADFRFLFGGRDQTGQDRIYAVNPSGQLLSYGDSGALGNVSNPMVVGFGGWTDFKFLFGGRDQTGQDRIYAVDNAGQLLSYGDAATPGNVSDPVIVGLGGWTDFKFLFGGRDQTGQDRIYAVDNAGQLLSYGDAATPGNVSDPVIVGFGGWTDFKFLFGGRDQTGQDRIYAVDNAGQLLSYGDAATPGNVSDPVIVGFGGWTDFKFLFGGRDQTGQDRIYAVVPGV